MSKQSAGVLVYKQTNGNLQVLLVHPGGPFWKNKDDGAWSIPKGEIEDGEDELIVAKREFEEETGVSLPAKKFIPLKPVKIKSGKIIAAWALETDIELANFHSNHFEIEWPPRSGKMKSFPEVDKAEWFALDEAFKKINTGQSDFLIQLKKMFANNP